MSSYENDKMSHIEFKKQDDILDKFENGEYRYHHSVLFRACVDGLLFGQEPYRIIDILLQHIEEQQKQMDRIMGVPEQYMEKEN